MRRPSQRRAAAGYRGLAASIIWKAVSDYKAYGRYKSLDKLPKTDKAEAAAVMAREFDFPSIRLEVEQFFASDWLDDLCLISGIDRRQVHLWMASRNKTRRERTEGSPRKTRK